MGDGRNTSRTTLRSPDTYARLLTHLQRLDDDGDDIPCRREEINPDWWFSDEEREVRRAKMLCRVCPVLLLCRSHGISQHEYGIWGGLDHRERLILQRPYLRTVDTERGAEKEELWAIS